MEGQSARAHEAQIIEQFTHQAVPFTQVHGHLNAIDLLIEMAQVRSSDKVLDVACGPGLVACEFARHAGEVHGVDLTRAMIEQARRRQAESGLRNLDFRVGDAVPLIFDDASFDCVVTRYSFHHFLEPQRALTEMIRVCKPGGRILVADIAQRAEVSIAFDHLETLRDASHTHALTEQEFHMLFAQSGLTDCRHATYPVEVELESQLAASHMSEDARQQVREMVIADIGIDALGIAARHEDAEVKFSYPIGVWVGRKI
jgi:ubiquinone/menaquinone biosynthesis C-methylase UbiE